MREITKLTVTREQLAAKHFYYNGCECINKNADLQEVGKEIIDLAADVLIDILKNTYVKEVQ